MTRMTEKWHEPKKHMETVNTSKGYSISASDLSIKISNGYSLAIIDSNRNVLQQGATVEAEIFDVIGKEVVRVLCKKFKGFQHSDFEQDP